MLTLEFSSPVSGTILDKDGEGTGFTTVQGNKAGNQKVPSLIDLNNGRVTLTATKGSSVGGINTLKNALQVGLDPSETFTVSTRLKGPLTNLTTASQQAGIFFGPDQNNYVKLVVGKASNGLRIQLFRELNGISSSVDLATVPNSASLRTLDLYLTGDAERKTFSAAYRLNSDTGARLTLDQNFRLPQNLTDRFFGNATTARAGILAYTDQAPEVPISFFSFGIAQNVKINFQPSDSFLPTGYTKDSGLAYAATRGFGWIDQATGLPINISGFARDRNLTNADQRIDTLQHMQFGSTPDAAWEYAVPNGTYNVTVSVGDTVNARGVYDSQHTIRVEGDTLINQFQGSNTQKYQLNSSTVKVTDGKLTIDALGGFNTKINYLEIVPISPGNHPSIPDSFPRTSAIDVRLDAAIATDVFLPNVGQGVDAATLNLNTVQLYQTFNKEVVEGNFNTSGGNDTIVFQPTGLLKPNTNYTFRVTEGVRDQSGATFQPFSTTFTTGTEFTGITPGVNFKQQQVYKGAPISSLAISPDGSKLYGAGLDGSVHRWTINSSTGKLSGEQIFRNPQLAGRAIIGITFDPNNPRALWISHNNPLEPEPAKDFSGKISKLTLNAGTSFNPSVQDYVVGLPRSAKDHLTQSIAFGPDGKLYVSQGSNSAMGAPDAAWFNRAENLLSGAILQIDPRRTPPRGGFNVQTEDRGAANYNPFAANAPVKIFATGIRNAYDLVWHRNGNLYVPTNGSAAGGNTPEDPTQAGNQALTNVATQDDYLFRIGPNGGGYYGHPNPLRGEYILNGGNPTTAADHAEVIKPTLDSPYSGYADFTARDPDYQGYAYDFGRNRSPNGAIEYKSGRFGRALQNQLLVTEFSAGDDILAIPLGADGNASAGATKVFSNLTDPLDLIENTRNGNLYVAELPNNGRSGGQITLLS